MSGKGWTDTEKVGFFFQIISKMGASIPWHELELPEGRTLKACQVMVDKEKTKIRKAKEAEGDSEGGPATPKASASGKKRGVKAIDEEDGSVKKKAKTPRKAKPKEQAKEDSSNEGGGGDGEGLVKGNRLSTGKTIWHRYVETAAADPDETVLMLGHEMLEMTDTMEECDFFGDRLVVLRAVEGPAGLRNEKSLTEGQIPEEPVMIDD